MKKALLLLALFSLVGCSKKDGIVLFGVTLGDDSGNAPKGELVSTEFGVNRYHFEHNPKLDGEWRCFYDIRDDIIVSVSGLCWGDVDLQENFEACREWLKQNVPYDKITDDREQDFTTYSNTVTSSCSIYKGLLKIEVTLLGDVKKRQRRNKTPDLSK